MFLELKRFLRTRDEMHFLGMWFDDQIEWEARDFNARSDADDTKREEFYHASMLRSPSVQSVVCCNLISRGTVLFARSNARRCINIDEMGKLAIVSAKFSKGRYTVQNNEIFRRMSTSFFSSKHYENEEDAFLQIIRVVFYVESG